MTETWILEKKTTGEDWDRWGIATSPEGLMSGVQWTCRIEYVMNDRLRTVQTVITFYRCKPTGEIWRIRRLPP